MSGKLQEASSSKRCGKCSLFHSLEVDAEYLAANDGQVRCMFCDKRFFDVGVLPSGGRTELKCGYCNHLVNIIYIKTET